MHDEGLPYMNGKVALGITIVAVILAAAVIHYFRASITAEGRLVVATTTSLYDTRLLDVIEDSFEERYSINIYFISVGTGLAIEHARRGDADLILVHDPARELLFLEEGYGVCRKIIAYNFFTIIGPADDPAGIKGLSPPQALAKIVEAGRKGACKWVSRGDESGTHAKEKWLWREGGFDWEAIKSEAWYMEAGTGMGKTLQIANEKSAYTLSDLGTYLKYYKEGLISLEALVTRGKELLNVYSVIAVNPSLYPKANFEGAIKFIKFLISDKGQKIIGEYGKEIYGESLFQSAVKLLEEEEDQTLVQWLREVAFFNGTECPLEYWDNHPELYE